MVFILEQPFAGPRKLTQSVLQITQMLAMYQAELARILQVRCHDIGLYANGQAWLEPGTASWDQAVLFVRFYETLYTVMAGDGVAMRHWLRTENRDLNGMPLLLIIDDNQLRRVLFYVETLKVNKT